MTIEKEDGATMQIDLNILFNADPTVFEIKREDKETPANISVADLKELALAIHVGNDRIQSLYKDLQQAEARIDQLERRLDTIAGAQEEEMSQFFGKVTRQTSH
jgi:predicted RNase H-like nuclease (RuvC/YqgF family)